MIGPILVESPGLDENFSDSEKEYLESIGVKCQLPRPEDRSFRYPYTPEDVVNK